MRLRALRDAPKLSHAVYLAQVHACHNGRETLVQGSAGKRIFKQRRNHGVRLTKDDVEASGGEQERILPQASRRIKDTRGRLPFYPRDLYEELTRQPIGPDARQHRGKIGTQLHAVAGKHKAALLAPQLEPRRPRHLFCLGHAPALHPTSHQKPPAVMVDPMRARAFRHQLPAYCTSGDGEPRDCGVPAYAQQHTFQENENRANWGFDNLTYISTVEMYVKFYP